MQLGLEQMGKVAGERARPNDSTHNVVMPGEGSPTVVTGGDTNVIIICRHCNRKVPRRAKFCEHCGQPL